MFTFKRQGETHNAEKTSVSKLANKCKPDRRERMFFLEFLMQSTFWVTRENEIKSGKFKIKNSDRKYLIRTQLGSFG